jgi:hypothetical protein
MRIGVSGSAGSGKTTLCKALAEHLGVPYIGDTTEEALAEIGRRDWKGITDLRVRKTVRIDAINRKIKAEMAAEAFVSEKTVVDYLAYWMQNQAEHETREQNMAVHELVVSHVARYTHRVFLPYRAEIEFAAGRNQDPFHALRVAANVFGLYAMIEQPAIVAPYTFGEDIAAWIERYLGEGGAPAPVAAPKAAKRAAAAPAADTGAGSGSPSKEAAAPISEADALGAKAFKRKTAKKGTKQ